MKPENTTYNANETPDWVRGVCMETVPTETWMAGGLDRAAVLLMSATRKRGEEATRLAVRAMDPVKLVAWLTGVQHGE